MVDKAWGTILTADSYVVGCLILHYSLQRVHTTYPLIVLATSTISAKAREKVKARGIEIVDIDHFEPTRAHTYGVERFRDTWNKLAVFQLEQFERLILLDCDMLVRSNMDELMNIPLEENQIAASYACACNPRRFPHYPKTWIPANCPHTHSEIELSGSPRPPPVLSPTPLNSGLVVLRPSRKLYQDIIRYIEEDEKVPSFEFPDQDVLAHFFGDENIVRLKYVYNAIKPMRYVHPRLWRDEEVKNVHYILNKPWNGKLKEDDLDFQTHEWWWQAYEELKTQEGDVLAEFNKS